MQFPGSEAFEAVEEMMVSVPQLVDMATRLWFINKERFFMRVCSEEPLDFLLFDCELCAEKTCKKLFSPPMENDIARYFFASFQVLKTDQMERGRPFTEL